MTELPIVDRWQLPAPVLERERSFWELYADRLEQLRELWSKSQSLQKIHDDFDTWILETEPAVILLELAAFGDVHFITEMNEWARVVLLAHFAKDTDLDAHAEREGLYRFDGEGDERLLERIILERTGKSAYGADPWYSRHARNADGRVREVAITGNRRRKVEIAILSTDNGGVPSDDLINKLQGVLANPPVARNNDIVSVIPAILATTDIEADIWLNDDAPDEVIAGLGDAVKAKWNEGRRLGRDLVASWIVAQLHVSGVQRVRVVTNDVIVPSNRGVAIGAIKLNIQGRDW